jgi:hypothetical protein
VPSQFGRNLHRRPTLGRLFPIIYKNVPSQ